MTKYLDLRSQNYEYRSVRNNTLEFDIHDWKTSPYSCFKARIYIELSTLFAFFFKNTSLTPNHISIIYGICGVIAGLCLASNINYLMVSGLIIFFLKGSLDWTDGFIAKIKNQKSSVGHILDTWGSHIGGLSLITSIGFYCYNNTQNDIYLFLTIIILFLRIIDFKFFAFHQLFYELFNKDNNIEIERKNIEKGIKQTNIFAKIIKNFMDDRARTVDLVCLLIFIEIFFSINNFSKIILGLYLIKTIIFFLGTFYVYYYKDALQKKIK